MVLQPKDRGPRITVPCVRCGGPARLTNVETVMFSNGVQQAIYECDCGGTVKRVLPSESGQASRQTGPYAGHPTTVPRMGDEGLDLRSGSIRGSHSTRRSFS